MERLDAHAPRELHALGNLALLALPKTALFCSARCPGDAILRAHDQAAHWRDTGRCIISGFHSPVEQECLRILLRGTQPIILCPPRSLPQRFPDEWHAPLAAGRLLILSAFAPAEKRVTAELATRRNALVAALADEVCFAHIAQGGQSDRLTHRLTAWGRKRKGQDFYQRPGKRPRWTSDHPNLAKERPCFHAFSFESSVVHSSRHQKAMETPVGSQGWAGF